MTTRKWRRSVRQLQSCSTHHRRARKDAPGNSLSENSTFNIHASRKCPLQKMLPLKVDTHVNQSPFLKRKPNPKPSKQKSRQPPTANCKLYATSGCLARRKH